MSAEANLQDLPRVLARPPWISGRTSRWIEPVRVVAKKGPKDLSAEDVAEHVANLKANKATYDVDSAAVAVALLDSTCLFGGWRSDNDACAWQYFETHVETTLAAIIPIAVGEGGPRRKIAERVVRRFARRDAVLVRTIAKRFGKRVVESMEEILGVDPRFDCPNAAPELPQCYRADRFTRPRLRDGRVLPLVAVDRIGHMLAFSSLDRPYEGLSDIKNVCDDRSLAELAWDMARAWGAADAMKKDQWMLESIAHLADDTVIRRTTPAIAHPEIVRVLGYVPTNAAATELCTIAWRVSHEKAKAHTLASVADAFARLARKRGLTVDELEDSLVPTIAPAEPNDESAPVSSRLAAMRSKSIDARVTVEYGARRLVVGIDERLDPFVQTHGGTKLRELPTPNADDDHDKIATVQEIWRELQEDVAAISDVRIRSLERAMVSGRSWTLEAFEHAWLQHPLMRHVALGVIWRSGATPFRVAEDGTFADIADTTLPLASNIAVAHPAEMTADEIVRWALVLADYRIIQPIEQIARRVLRDVKGDSVVLAPSAPTSQGELYERFRNCAFEVGVRAGKYMASRRCARTPGKLTLTFELANQKVSRLTLTAERNSAAIDLERIHAVDLSEIAHDLGVQLA